MTTIAFVDIETTGLDPIRHEPWEIAVIRREPDGTETEHLWQLRPSTAHLQHAADPEALRIGRYHERAAVPTDATAADMLAPNGPAPLAVLDVTRQIFQALRGTVMVGSNPAFDAAFLHRMLQLPQPPWHYRVIDTATLAAGFRLGQAASGAYGGDFLFPSDFPSLPFSSRALSRAVGVEPPGDGVAHTALGDARWARDFYDAITHSNPA
ncbi:3'-5' exonuclease [Streptomyces leeuwenhoekii]|uniref:Sle1_054 protein n=1 Tax=Streptomyces leeuwenhoekii TaxID=1437453 RepID=A0A0F7VQY2_STRLW|nr:3'-5' exonuclease [Streptomyces leeuwenhoekii]CQR59221.1 sle1_054 [Streptomyces leeuwenhoekii]